jgi:hypothetical protein
MGTSEVERRPGVVNATAYREQPHASATASAELRDCAPASTGAVSRQIVKERSARLERRDPSIARSRRSASDGLESENKKARILVGPGL